MCPREAAVVFSTHWQTFSARIGNTAKHQEPVGAGRLGVGQDQEGIAGVIERAGYAVVLAIHCGLHSELQSSEVASWGSPTAGLGTSGPLQSLLPSLPDSEVGA